MLKLFLSPKAELDLEDIYEYTLNTWGSKQAEKYQDELYYAMQTILADPHIGSIYYHKAGNYRKLNSNKHLIFYIIEVDRCIVMRILHERMDLKMNLE